MGGHRLLSTSGAGTGSRGLLVALRTEKIMMLYLPYVIQNENDASLQNTQLEVPQTSAYSKMGTLICFSISNSSSPQKNFPSFLIHLLCWALSMFLVCITGNSIWEVLVNDASPLSIYLADIHPSEFSFRITPSRKTSLILEVQALELHASCSLKHNLL